MVCDVSRAFFYGPVQHEMYVELCEAKKTVEDNNMCAKLRMSMYGTKAAAQNWQKKVQETMATLGFSIGKASPALFCHPQRSLKCLVHGTTSLYQENSRSGLGEKRVGVEAGNQYYNTWRQAGMSKEVKILNRKLCWHESGYLTRQTRNTQKQSSAKQEHPI